MHFSKMSCSNQEQIFLLYTDANASSGIPAPVPLPDTHHSCSAYRKRRPASTDKPRNGKRIPMQHPVKYLVVWQSAQ